MDPSTPAASIQWGTTPRQRTVVATVSNLAQKLEQAGLSPPVMTIIGKVVSLRETMNWFEEKTPLRPDNRRHPHAPAGERPDDATGGPRGRDPRGPRRSKSPRRKTRRRSIRRWRACTNTTGSSSPAPTALRRPKRS
jgi:hypothetical protein